MQVPGTKFSDSQFSDAILLAAGMCAFVGVWELASAITTAAAVFVPRPTQLFSTAVGEIQSGRFATALAGSLYHLSIGVLCGSILGVVAGCVLGLSHNICAAMWGAISLLRPIPSLAWVPLTILWFGVSQGAAIFIIAQGVFWVTLISTQGAVENVNRDFVELGRSLGVTSRFALTKTFILPDVMPGIVTGLRNSVGQAWTVVVAAELCGVNGVGLRLWEAGSLISTQQVGFYMAVIGLLAASADIACRAVERRLFRWRPLR